VSLFSNTRLAGDDLSFCRRESASFSEVPAVCLACFARFFAARRCRLSSVGAVLSNGLVIVLCDRGTNECDGRRTDVLAFSPMTGGRTDRFIFLCCGRQVKRPLTGDPKKSRERRARQRRGRRNYKEAIRHNRPPAVALTLRRGRPDRPIDPDIDRALRITAALPKLRARVLPTHQTNQPFVSFLPFALFISDHDDNGTPPTPSGFAVLRRVRHASGIL